MNTSIKITDINYNTNEVIFKYLNKEYKIPSKEFPLGDNRRCLYNENTKNLKNKKIEDIYNKQVIGQAQCFDNSNGLFNDLINERVCNKHNLKIMAGWLFVGFNLPVYHCFLLYKDAYVLDLTINTNTKEINDVLNSGISIDDKRRKVAEIINEMADDKNSDKTTFGKMTEEKFFIGSEFKTVEDAVELYKELIDDNPNHITIVETNNRGLSKTQQMIKEK